AAVSSDALKSVVDVKIAVRLCVSQVNEGGTSPKDFRKLLLRLLQRFLGPPALGDIRYHRQCPIELSRVPDDRVRYHPDPYFRSIFSPEPFLNLFAQPLLAAR